MSLFLTCSFFYFDIIMFSGFKPIPTVAGKLNYIGECKRGLSGACAECEGDCDYDSDCQTGFRCFHRDGGEAIPGCTGGSVF